MKKIFLILISILIIVSCKPKPELEKIRFTYNEPITFVKLKEIVNNLCTQYDDNKYTLNFFETWNGFGIDITEKEMNDR